MSRDPFDEFREIKKLFQKMMGDGNLSMEGSGYSISVKQSGDKTRVDIRGEVNKKDIKKLKRKYPNAEIYVNGSMAEESENVEVISEEEEIKEKQRSKNKTPMVEEVDEDELEPEELALKRFKEKEKDKK